jgi:hypothetical protein
MIIHIVYMNKYDETGAYFFGTLIFIASIYIIYILIRIFIIAFNPSYYQDHELKPYGI